MAKEMINTVIKSQLFEVQCVGCDASFGSDHTFLDSLPETMDKKRIRALTAAVLTLSLVVSSATLASATSLDNSAAQQTEILEAFISEGDGYSFDNKDLLVEDGSVKEVETVDIYTITTQAESVTLA